MKRAAIYGRYSTDLQDERSIADQFAVCRTYAGREGLNVIGTYEDRAVSGASMHGRYGLQELLRDAAAGKFDVLIAESMSRIGRDQEDRAAIRKRLQFAGVRIMTPGDGLVSPLMDGIRAVIDSQQLEDMKVMIRRGLAGVVREGRVPGGAAYGYRIVNRLDDRGDVIRGLREVDEEHAEIVRRVFREYAAGRSPREIAATLNAARVPPPKGQFWNASTINGFAQRGSGMLRNELYRGFIVWNRTRKLRNPDTGKRVPRVNQADDRHVTEAPHLRIIDEELWQAVQARIAGRSRDPRTWTRRPRHLLSGLLRCGACGSGMTVIDRDKTGKTRIRCSAVRENGSCTSRRVLYLNAVEAAVIDGMRKQLEDPRLIEAFVRRYNETRRRLARELITGRSKLEARLGAVTREHERLLQGFVKGFVDEAEAEARLPALRAEKEQLAAELATVGEEPKVVSLHPGLIDAYLVQVNDLSALLAEHAHAPPEDDASRALVERFRSLVETITVHPHAPRQGFEVEVKGRLAALIGPEAFPARRAVVGEEWCRKRGSNSRPPHYE
jgi:site-specific DNA recombinase